MNEEQPGNWWSWAPDFPRWAIIGAAIIFDLVAYQTITANAAEAKGQFPDLIFIHQAVFTESIIANFLSLAVGLQLNTEVFHMILSMKANWNAVQKAKAQGEARGEARGQAQGEAAAEARIEARIQSWYETHKDQMGPDVPPPPINGNKPDNIR